jgi:hypothetical protein
MRNLLFISHCKILPVGLIQAATLDLGTSVHTWTARSASPIAQGDRVKPHNYLRRAVDAASLRSADRRHTYQSHTCS